jgi:hypothetical protein
MSFFTAGSSPSRRYSLATTLASGSSLGDAMLGPFAVSAVWAVAPLRMSAGVFRGSGCGASRATTPLAGRIQVGLPCVLSAKLGEPVRCMGAPVLTVGDDSGLSSNCREKGCCRARAAAGRWPGGSARTRRVFGPGRFSLLLRRRQSRGRRGAAGAAVGAALSQRADGTGVIWDMLAGPRANCKA